MTISPLIPAAGVAVGAGALRAAKSLAGGLSFADMFRRADQAQPAPSQATPPANGAAPASASTDPQQLLKNFQELVKRKLAAVGLDASQPIELTDLGDDRVRVGSDNLDWTKIEQLFDNDPSLRDAFRQVADAFARQNPAAEGQRCKLLLTGDRASVAFE